MEIMPCYEKYLGLPAVITTNRKNMFDLIKERVAKKVEHWGKKGFSRWKKGNTS